MPEFDVADPPRLEPVGAPQVAPERIGPWRGGGPWLNTAEWALLLDIYPRNRGKAIGSAHPELRAASELLPLRVSKRGQASVGTVLRSPHGLARRITVLRALDRGDLIRGPRHGRCASDSDPIRSGA